MKMKDGPSAVFTFEGIPAGDGECFCFAVDANTFYRITGEKPGDWSLIPAWIAENNPDLRDKHALSPYHLFPKGHTLFEVSSWKG